jgi:DNA processing protein
MTERDYYLFFSNFPGVGPVKFRKILTYFGSAKKAWNSTSSDLDKIIGSKTAVKLENFRNEFDLENYLKQLKRQKIEYVCLADKQYPPLLKKIQNPPIVLYLKGNTKLLNSNVLKKTRMIAIVGTRHITHYGREVTKMFSGKLAENGLVIVSGMAYGVDGVAHKSCIDAGGETIAVLGNGVDMAYPRENSKLYEEIIDSGGLIISEFPPGTPPSVGSFPSRNRIVAGLSEAVLVTEGASDSGSLITANYGLEFGRKVFAVPGPVTSSLSAAPLRLIEKGARLVVGPDDIMRELNVESKKLKDKKSYAGLSKEEVKVIELIENESLSFDEIAQRLKLDSAKLASILSMMEIKGIIKSSDGGYSITN